MAPPRKWDHDEGLRLFTEEGWPISRIAGHMGVAAAAVRLVCDPSYRERRRESARRSGKSAVCVDCGAPIWKAGSGNGASGLRCVSCAARLRATTVRDETLRCSECGEWKADRDFPRQAGRISRRGRHSICRACGAAARRRSRHARRVPCTKCGAPRDHPTDIGRRGYGDTGLCAGCYRKSPEFREAMLKGVAVSAAARRKAAA